MRTFRCRSQRNCTRVHPPKSVYNTIDSQTNQLYFILPLTSGRSRAIMRSGNLPRRFLAHFIILLVLHVPLDNAENLEFYQGKYLHNYNMRVHTSLLSRHKNLCRIFQHKSTFHSLFFYLFVLNLTRMPIIAIFINIIAKSKQFIKIVIIFDYRFLRVVDQNENQSYCIWFRTPSSCGYHKFCFFFRFSSVFTNFIDGVRQNTSFLFFFGSHKLFLRKNCADSNELKNVPINFSYVVFQRCQLIDKC